jgi:DNA-binding transcriptional regulator YhcF (GntR family)
MVRKPITQTIEEIQTILKKEGELSIRQLSIKAGSQWRTIEKALETMKKLNVVKERAGKETDRVERLFSIKN